jgi:type II secretory pathway pseudopilin PulG
MTVVLLRISQLLNKNKKIGGVTLIELVITIGIISLLSYLIIVKSFFISNKLEKIELKQIESSINSTRNYSIVTRKPQSITFNFVNNNYINSLEQEAIKLKKLKLNKDKSNIETFSFTKNGSPTYKGAGTIFLIGEKKEYSIAVTPVTGKVNARELNE